MYRVFTLKKLIMSPGNALLPTWKELFYWFAKLWFITSQYLGWYVFNILWTTLNLKKIPSMLCDVNLPFAATKDTLYFYIYPVIRAQFLKRILCHFRKKLLNIFKRNTLWRFAFLIWHMNIFLLLYRICKSTNTNFEFSKIFI